MSDPIILSDEESVGEEVPETPSSSILKKHRPVNSSISSAVVIIDDDPTPPSKSCMVNSDSITTIEVPETPLSDGGAVMVPRALLNYASVSNLKEITGELCFESESNEPERPVADIVLGEGVVSANINDADEGSFILSPPKFLRPNEFQGPSSDRVPLMTMENNFSKPATANDSPTMGRLEPVIGKCSDGLPIKRKKISQEEKQRLQEQRKLLREQEKSRKAVLKDQEKLQKKVAIQKKKWETGKFALKSIVAEIDTKVVEQGSVGGHLLTKFSEKSIGYRIASNIIDRSVVWRMDIPDVFSQLTIKGNEVQYVLLVYDAEEFCNIIANDMLNDHIAKVRSCYPSYRICYLTNRLMAYVNKREREKYKGKDVDDWRCPPIDEAMSLLTTHFDNVHYRHCRDEAEVAEHVVGLTCSLASCQYRTKLTKYSVSANGSVIPRDCVDRNLIKKSSWLKALVAIPKVQPRFAIAIWKKYPTMKSLLREYMDSAKSVYEKEFLLEDLLVEGLLGGERRVGAVCSKRVYRILMASHGDILTDDVEDGADQFTTPLS